MKTPLLHRLPGGHPAWALLLTALLTGCAAGPDYQAPGPLADNALPHPAPAVQNSASETAFGAAQTWRADMDLEAPWWQQLGSPGLEKIIIGKSVPNTVMPLFMQATPVASPPGGTAK